MLRQPWAHVLWVLQSLAAWTLREAPTTLLRGLLSVVCCELVSMDLDWGSFSASILFIMLGGPDGWLEACAEPRYEALNPSIRPFLVVSM